MAKYGVLLVAALIAVGVSDRVSSTAAQSAGGADSRFETIATLNVANTENIFEAEDGTFYVTGHQALNVLRITPDRKVDTFVTVPGLAHVLGIAGTDNGFVLSASERTFRKPDASGRMQFDFSDTGPVVVVLDKKGTITGTLRGAKGAFFNGIAAGHANGQPLILSADSNSGTVWRVDLAKKQIEPWLTDPVLAPTAEAPIGPNGIKIYNDWVYVNSRGTMYRVRIGGDNRPQGTETLVARAIGNDDFGLTKDGTLYILDASTMKRISPSGEVSIAYDKVPPGPAAWVSRDGKWLYWPTRGGDGPQRLLRAPIP